MIHQSAAFVPPKLFVARIGFCFALVILTLACRAADTSDTSEVTPTDETELRATFEKIAPLGWSLRRYEKGIADYSVTIPSPSLDLQPIIISGAITLDGRNETLVKLARATIRLTDESQRDIQKSSALSRDFDGYIKAVSVASVGYDLKEKRNIHQIEYYNFDAGVSCYGHDPGQFQCYWGKPDNRFSLYFSSKNLDVVLPYVKKIAGSRGPKA